MTDYGMIWPLTAITSWMADDTMVLAAKTGTSLGPSIYDEIPARMTTAPGDVTEAYEQATYFVALAIRRALREGNSAAADALQADLDQLLVEGDAVRDETGWMCSTLGVGCPRGGSAPVLQDAIEAVETSGLGQDDVVQISTILASNRRSFLVWQAVPVVVAVGLGATVGLWWRRRRQAS